MTAGRFVPLSGYQSYPENEMERRVRDYHQELDRRRSVRHFSSQPVPRSVIEGCLRAAGTAPSGAHRQPWHFVAVSDPAVKRRIREGAEQEEHEFYTRRASADWLRDLRAVGTDEHKPFLEIAPWLIVVFKLMKDDVEDGASDQVYYVNESVGIAAGLLLAAAHQAGLVTLTHTPSPMKFLAQILNRPDYERPYLLIPVGYPAEDCVVPDLERKKLEEIMIVDR